MKITVAQSLEWLGVLTAIAYSLFVASNTGLEFFGFALLLISAFSIGLWAYLGGIVAFYCCSFSMRLPESSACYGGFNHAKRVASSPQTCGFGSIDCGVCDTPFDVVPLCACSLTVIWVAANAEAEMMPQSSIICLNSTS